MNKIINSEILSKVGKPSEMVDEMLDKQIESLEANLGNKAKGVGNRLLSYFLLNGNRVQLGGTEVVERLQQDMQIDGQTANAILETLQNSGILRKTSAGRLEIANNFLAQRAFQKVESENRVLRNIKNTIQDRMSRNELLDQAYLNHITPSLPLLDLSEKEHDFVKASQAALRRTKRAIGIFRTLIFFFLIGLAAWAIWEYNRANKNFNQQLEYSADMEQAKIKAEKALEEAKIARKEAESAREDALQLQEIAERNAFEAEAQRTRAEALLRAARADRDSISKLNATVLQQIADLEELSRQYRDQADENAELAEKARRREIQALDAQSKAEKLNKVITSWNAAARSLQIEDARTKALVAMEAYKINRDNPEVGDVKHPNIMKALEDAARLLDQKLQFDIKKAHAGAVRDIVFQPGADVFFTTGSDGAVKKWEVKNWSDLGAPVINRSTDIYRQKIGINNSLAISPNGKNLLVAGEMPWFQTLNAETGKALDTFRIAGRDEVFSAGITNDGEFIASGFERFYHRRPRSSSLDISPKSRGKANLILPDNGSICAYSLVGKPGDFFYQFNVDSICGNSAGSAEFMVFGGKREIDYGVISAVGYHTVSDSTALLAIGFSNGRILLIESYRDGDRFQPTEQGRKMFKPHLAAITDFAFNPAGDQLAIASMDGTISLWDLKEYTSPTYQPVVFARNSGWVFSIAFSNDGKHIVAGCQDGSIFFWNVDPEDYARFLCSNLQNTLAGAAEEQRNVDVLQKKSVEPYRYNFDELPKDDYRRYFGDIDPGLLPRRRVTVCD